MKMKKLLFLLIFGCFFIFAFDSNSFATNEPNLTAKSAILIDNATNKVLYSKNASEKMYPASTTKILTAILTLENCNLNDFVTASYDAVMSIPNGYSTADIQIGEELTVEQLLEMLLVYSANDASMVLAEYVGGSVNSFVSMMNTKLNELGLYSTHFTNPYGFQDSNHYTTSYDLARLMQYCLKNENFRKIAGLASCAIPTTNKHAARLYTSTNDLLVPNNEYYYKYCTVGKTGFTTAAGNCLVSCSYKDNLELIGVVLGTNSNDSSLRFTESIDLYEYGYSNYSVENIVNKNDIITSLEVSGATKNTKNLNLLADSDVSALVNNSELEFIDNIDFYNSSLSTNSDTVSAEIVLNNNISAPIESGETLGKLVYKINDIEYSTNLIAANNVEKSMFIIYCIYGFIILILLFTIYKICFRNKNNID